MNKKYMNEIVKKGLLVEICNFYGYKLTMEDGRVNCYFDKELNFDYKNLDEALIEWYYTLHESNEIHEGLSEINKYTVWTKYEMDVIRNIITQNALKLVKSRIKSEECFNHIYKNEYFVLDFGVDIVSECQGEVISSNLKDWCTTIINENKDFLNYDAYDAEEKVIEEIKNENELMQSYIQMYKCYSDNLKDVGKYLVGLVKTEGFYDYVNWNDLKDDYFMTVGYEIYEHEESLKELIKYNLEEVSEYCDATYDLIKRIVDTNLEKFGYYFNDDCMFIQEKTIESLKNLLDSNNVQYKPITFTEHENNNVVESEILKINTNSNGDYIEVSIEDGRLEYNVVTGLNENELEDHCSLTKYLFEDGSKLIDFLNRCIGKVKEKCFRCKKEVFLEDRYDLQKCPNCGEEVLPKDSQSKIVVKEIYDVDTVNQVYEERYDFQMYFDFENSDAINEYFIDWIEGFHFIGCIVDKKDGVFDLDNCEIDMVWNGNNGEKFPFTDEQIRTIKDKVAKEIKDNNMGEIKDREDKIEEELVNNMNTLQVKYDIDLQYKGTEFVGVVQCHKVSCQGLPCIKDDKLEFVSAIYSQKGCERYVIKFIEINNIIYPILDANISWYGIDTDKLFDQLNTIIIEKEIPKSYIKVSDEYYKVESIQDILDIFAEGDIEEYHLENEMLSKITKEYLGCEINFLIEDLKEVLSIIQNDYDALEDLVNKEAHLDYWLNDVELFHYFDYTLMEAYETYLEEEEKLPNKIMDYLDIESYIENEKTVRNIECSNCIMLYC